MKMRSSDVYNTWGGDRMGELAQKAYLVTICCQDNHISQVEEWLHSG